MRIDERAPPDVHCGRRVTFKTILTTGPSRCGAGFKALLIIDEDECSPLDSVANRHETIPLKRGRFSAGMKTQEPISICSSWFKVLEKVRLTGCEGSQPPSCSSISPPAVQSGVRWH